MTRSNEAVLDAATNSPVRAAPPVLVELLGETGIRFNGDQTWDIQVRDEALYNRILGKGSLGFGEAYMDGLWECEHLDELFTRLLRHDINDRIRGWTRMRLLAGWLRNRILNPQSYQRAFHVGEHHYDIGNDVFEAMLDTSMSYSCGYWANADTLEQAQQHKLDLICKKLELKEGEWLLDIGCGWGGLARHAAEHYGVAVTGITVSREQLRLARERCTGLPVNIELMDYRDLNGSFDKIVSVGMFEHVGPKNYPIYFDTVQRLLADDGLFLLHTIGDYTTGHNTDPWIDKYIFPNSKLPSATQIAGGLEDRFIIDDWHSFGADYDRTLMAWWDNFDAAWPQLKDDYDGRFYRMWRYYLMSCAGLFRSRQGQLWQLVLSKRRRSQIYRSLR